MDLSLINKQGVSITSLVPKALKSSKRSVMFATQILGLNFFKTIFNYTSGFRRVVGDGIIFPVYMSFFIFSIVPHIFMEIIYMLTLTRNQFKIFYSIISSNSIFVVNFFFGGKLSTKMLFHYQSMLKNFSIWSPKDIVSIVSKIWSSSFQVSPVWRDVITFVPEPSTSVSLADLTIKFFKNFFTPFDFAYLSQHYTDSNEL